MFIRDADYRGEAAIEEGGPRGHHFTCDFVTPTQIYSFRFTMEESLGQFVLDRNFPVNANGKITVLKPGHTPYNPATGTCRHRFCVFWGDGALGRRLLGEYRLLVFALAHGL